MADTTWLASSDPQDVTRMAYSAAINSRAISSMESGT